MKHLLFTLSLLLPITTFGAFTDVSDDHINVDAINYVQAHNMVKGYDDGTFKPNQTINRAEFTKIIISSKFSKNEINECNLLTLNFSDISANQWFAPFVCIAKKKGIIEGYDDGTFKPAQEITFVEAAKIASSVFAKTLPDTNSDAWFAPFVSYLSDQSSIPYSIDKLAKKVTRGDIAEIIYRLHSNNTQKPSLKFIDDELIKQDIAETQEVPLNCQHWYDGCNECYRSDIGEPLKCTKKTCQFKGTPGCRFLFPAPVTILKAPSLNCKIWTDTVNTCSREKLGDAPTCTDNPTNKTKKDLKVTCTEEFEEEVIPSIGIKENPIYAPVSLANLEESVEAEKAIALYFHSFEDCPFCDSMDKDISTNLDDFPVNSIILNVRFDTDIYKELKEKWEVTEPNTVVVINKNKVTTFKKTNFTIDELKEALENALK